MRRPATAWSACLMVLGLVAMPGCQGTLSENDDTAPAAATPRLEQYPTPPPTAERNPQSAGAHNALAVDAIAKGDLATAEKELKEALAQDTFCGPAHNNLGLVYFHLGRFYQAAWEFQYASRLMPNKGEPANNLGMVYEAVGKPDDAAKYYETALKLEPGSVDAMGNLARIYVGQSRSDSRTRELLSEVVFRDLRPEWVAWARERLALMRKSEPADADVTPGR